MLPNSNYYGTCSITLSPLSWSSLIPEGNVFLEGGREVVVVAIALDVPSVVAAFDRECQGQGQPILELQVRDDTVNHVKTPEVREG